MMKVRSPSTYFAACFAAYIALLAVIALPGFMLGNVAWQWARDQKQQEASSIDLPSTIGGMPVILSKHDVIAYDEAFIAQRSQDWQTADQALARISNPILKGHVLADRYLHRSYSPSANELQEWLMAYRTLPQAYDISQAQQRITGFAVPSVPKPELISMRGDDNGLAATFDESKHYERWHRSIEAYRQGRYREAANGFEAMLADRKSLSPWKISAAGFWAWRTYEKLGEHGRASASLLIAAGEPRSFYGILARKQMGQPLELDQTALTLSPDQMERLAQVSAVMRATALMQVGKHDLAERELRLRYSHADREERYALLRLAHQFSLPALQIAIAKRLETHDQKLDLAKYPIPEWEPVGGFSVDPALIYALVRQESGFRTGAISPAGAMGLMQLMPGTANMMKGKVGAHVMMGATDAEKNITLGQSYVRHLLQNQLVDNNMIFMLAAYNAGIGRLQEWKSAMDYRGDPLLFIERMPYAETRYYVMQVMTNYWLYNELLGVSSPTLASLSRNQWPIYVASVMG